MSASKQTTRFGATIVPTSTHDDTLRAPPMLDSPALTPAVSQDDMSTEYTNRPIPPHSPFYQHPPASFERVESRQASKTHLAVYEKDLESGHVTPLTMADDENPFGSKISVDHNKECKMWPSKQTLIQQKTAEKKKRRDMKCCAGFGPVRDWWAQFTKRQQLLMKIALALVLIGVAVAIGVGISKAVHGTYYSSDGGQQQVGGTKN